MCHASHSNSRATASCARNAPINNSAVPSARLAGFRAHCSKRQALRLLADDQAKKQTPSPHAAGAETHALTPPTQWLTSHASRCASCLRRALSAVQTRCKRTT
ncbi:hypothetical protein GUJ93_ZPchr0009g1435 [Zizania palustris]|uniref:Uncharacterized protein n=1 Tax=Zizania palustris TaxID=103762 RepID=A0A8J5S1R4_ZIZPA|nr:hypothetical protein GUJ93_ZPchr0009g1435 [Zizania palustris]